MPRTSMEDLTRRSLVYYRAGMIARDVIDCDVHAVVPSVEALFPYLDEHWREYISQSGFKGPVDTAYPKAPTTARPGSTPPKGPAGSSLDLLREQALDAWGSRLAILNCSYAVDSIHNPDADVAIARAVNDWLVAEWLDREPRLRASIVVPSQLPPSPYLRYHSRPIRTPLRAGEWAGPRDTLAKGVRLVRKRLGFLSCQESHHWMIEA